MLNSHLNSQKQDMNGMKSQSEMIIFFHFNSKRKPDDRIRATNQLPLTTTPNRTMKALILFAFTVVWGRCDYSLIWWCRFPYVHTYTYGERSRVRVKSVSIALVSFSLSKCVLFIPYMRRHRRHSGALSTGHPPRTRDSGHDNIASRYQSISPFAYA